MWGTLLKIHKVLQSIRPLKVEYIHRNAVFQENPNRRKMIKAYLVDFNVILIWFASIIGLQSDNNRDESAFSQTDPEDGGSISLNKNAYLKAILDMVLKTLYVGIFSLLVISIWTFQYKSNAAVWMMNQAKLFYEKRERSEKQATLLEKRGKFKETLIFQLIVHNIVSICCVGIAIVALTPLVSQSTPAHLIFSLLFPHYFAKDTNPVTQAIICSVYLLVVAVPGAALICQALLYICTVLFESKYMLRAGYLFPQNQKVNASSGFARARKVYQQGFLFIQEYNAFGVVYFPFVMFIGMCINIITSYVCIKFHSEIPILLVVIFAGFDVGTIVVTIGLYGFTMISAEEGEKFVTFWKNKLFRQLQRKQFRACLPIRVKIGQFFLMQRTTLFSAFEEIINMTVTLLLLEE